MVGLLGEDRVRRGLDAGAPTHQSHLIPHGELATLDYFTHEYCIASRVPPRRVTS
jgi:hypothetical protein